MVAKVGSESRRREKTQKESPVDFRCVRNGNNEGSSAATNFHLIDDLPIFQIKVTRRIILPYEKMSISHDRHPLCARAILDGCFIEQVPFVDIRHSHRHSYETPHGSHAQKKHYELLDFFHWFIGWNLKV
jgi:hypothetical protein